MSDQNNTREENSNIASLAANIIVGQKDSNFLGLSSAHLENIAFQDFSEYAYILKPYVLIPPEGIIEDLDNIGQITPVERLFFRDLKMVIERQIIDSARFGGAGYVFLNKGYRASMVNKIIQTLRESSITNAYDKILELYTLAMKIDSLPERKFLNWLPIVPLNVFPLFFYWPIYWLVLGLDAYSWYYNYLKNRWKEIAETAYARWFDYLTTLKEEQLKRTVKGPLEYPFELYLPHSWNIGIRLVYRQEWRPLGNQRGEVVRTIPLGPKQIEKVSTKIVRRTKITKTAENLKSVEQTTELTDTTKDSTEIVNEASNEFGWHAEVEATYNVDAIFYDAGVKASAGAKQNIEERSKNMSNHLSETMQKTASKIRTETKTVVNTESESTYEVETASEIINPNEEIPITYVYSNLQRQYEIFTGLAEVQNVIMVAEPIPHPYEVDFEWVKKNDWILAKVLLDDSFRDALNSISQDPKPLDYTGLKDKLEEKLERITGTGGLLEKFAEGFDGGFSLNQVDMIQEAQKNYREALQKRFENLRQIEIIDEKRDRLYDHIRRNILHYCRAIWKHEDPQQRLLRYKKLRISVPTQWDFKGVFGETVYDADFTDTDENGVPDSDDGLDIDDLLQQIIENELNAEDITTFDLEGEFKGNWRSSIDITALINPAGPIGYHGNYAIYYLKPEFAGSDLFAMLHIMKTPYLYYPKTLHQLTAEEMLDINPIFMDPTLKRLTIRNLGKEPSEEEKLEMIQLVPELRVDQALAKQTSPETLQVFLGDRELFIKYYPEYLFRLERTRKFLLETNNLILDIEPGTGTALESFKLAHRGMDILKTLEEKKGLELENLKKAQLLEEGKYDYKYWPGNQKVVIFDEGKSAGVQQIFYSYLISELAFLSDISDNLEEQGIETTIEFLYKCRTPAMRKALLKALEVTDVDILYLANVADLMRIKGVGENEAILLEKVGVDTVKELANRKAENLAKLLETKAKEEKSKVPSLEEVKKWIEQASLLEGILEY